MAASVLPTIGIWDVNLSLRNAMQYHNTYFGFNVKVWGKSTFLSMGRRVLVLASFHVQPLFQLNMYCSFMCHNAAEFQTEPCSYFHDFPRPRREIWTKKCKIRERNENFLMNFSKFYSEKTRLKKRIFYKPFFETETRPRLL